VTLGLKEAANLWPDVDWYCYLEYDCLVGSNQFEKDLAIAESMGVWCLGNDHRVGNYKFPLLEAMLKTQFKESHYLLGCCVFYKQEFIKKLKEINFFERFLYLTNDFSQGYFPGYEEQGGYDLTEHLYPTLASHFGGKVAQFAAWSRKEGKWAGGNFGKYPFRFQPELHPEEHYPEAVIMHPLKGYDHPVREFHRKKRNDT
jgi:hypothetical protein